MSDEVRIERRDGWRKLVLNRPDKLNAANQAMLTRAACRARGCRGGSQLPRAAADRRGEGVLRGTGTGAGDVRCRGRLTSVPVAALHHRFVRHLRALPLPVVCAVNGVAAGAGASYALACDIVLAARSAKFIQAFVKVGLVPDSGATFFLPRLIGEARARALTMLGETMDAETRAGLGHDLARGG